MESYFWVGDQFDNFLFKGLNTKTWGGFLGVCIVLTFCSVIYEGLHLLKRFFLTRFLNARKCSIIIAKADNSETSGIQHEPSTSFSRRRRNQVQDNGSGESAPRNLLEETEVSEEHSPKFKLPISCSSSGFINLGISSALHSIYMFLGFTLMNAVMTFNVWILIAISIGIMAGYFCFGNYRNGDNIMNPFDLNTETTSLDEADITNATIVSVQGRQNDFGGGGDNLLNNPQSFVGSTLQDHDDPGELSKLIVGAEVHVPRIINSSANSNST